jgi:hypothetical protein
MNCQQELDSLARASIAASRRTGIALVRGATLFIALATNQMFFKLAHKTIMLRFLL